MKKQGIDFLQKSDIIKMVLKIKGKMILSKPEAVRAMN